MRFVAGRPMMLNGKPYKPGEEIPAELIPQRKLQALLNLRKVLTVPDLSPSAAARPAAFAGSGKGR